MERQSPACAEGDPRVKGFPCFGKHNTKQGQNQHAVWSTCQRCGLRMSYHSKKPMDGSYRSMGPHPNQTALALLEIEKVMPADRVTEKVVAGKLMELKGIQLQKGLTETTCINMSLNGHHLHILTFHPFVLRGDHQNFLVGLVLLLDVLNGVSLDVVLDPQLELLGIQIVDAVFLQVLLGTLQNQLIGHLGVLSLALGRNRHHLGVHNAVGVRQVGILGIHH